MKFFILFFSIFFLTSCNKDIGIIGGADGPTSILITEKASEDINYNKKDDWTEKYDEVVYEKYPDETYGQTFILVRKGEYWGIFNGLEEKEILSPDKYNFTKIRLNTYEEVYPLIEVEKDGYWGMIDYKGNMVIEPVWKNVCMDVYNVPNVVFVNDGEKWGGIKLSFKNYINQYEYDSVKAGDVDYSIELSEELKLRF